MNKKLLIPLFIIFVFLLLTPSFVFAQEQKEAPFEPVVPNLQINIPTVQFSNITKDGQMLGIPFLAEYISGIYKYAVAVVSIIAIVMIMIGGLRWMTAGGNASAVSGAREMISGATIGLFLLLGSYTVLYTINPDLVNFKSLQIQSIQPDLIIADWVDLTNEQLQEDVGGTAGSGSGNVPYFVQYDDKKNSWANQRCGSNPSALSGKTIAQAGCGITSYAMVLKYYFPSQNINPGVIAQLGSPSCSISALSADKLSKWGPVSITTINVKDLQKIQTLVSQGKPVIINCRPCVGLNPAGTLSSRKYGGHLMVLTGYSNGTFSVNDPGGNNSIRIASMTNEMITDPCKFVYSSDNNKSAQYAWSACNKKAAGGNVNTRPGFWYLRPAGK